MEDACKVLEDNFKSKLIFGDTTKVETMVCGWYLNKGGNNGTCMCYEGNSIQLLSPPFSSLILLLILLLLIILSIVIIILFHHHHLLLHLLCPSFSYHSNGLMGASLLLGAGIIVVILDPPPLCQSCRHLDLSFPPSLLRSI